MFVIDKPGRIDTLVQAKVASKEPVLGTSLAACLDLFVFNNRDAMNCLQSRRNQIKVHYEVYPHWKAVTPAASREF